MNLMKSKTYFTFFLFYLSSFSYSQSDLDKILKSGELLINGLSVLKSNKTESIDNKFNKHIQSLCVKNKLNEKIIFRLNGNDEEDNKITKELVVQNGGKECVFEIPKGIYVYEIILSNKEIYKKGEYKIDDDLIFTVKKEE